MKHKAEKQDTFLIVETPKEIRDEIVKDLKREIKRRRRELEDDVYRLLDAMRSPN